MHIDDWALQGMNYMVSKGLMEGFEGMIRPKDHALRCEMAQILYNSLSMSE